ncbi:MAG: ABC transporter ATP-binding protein [Actinomycetota bacterium]
MSVVTFDEVWKVFKDGTEAIRSLSLEVNDGEFFVFLGPSGSGKTTLLRAVAGLEDLTSGRILLDGKEISEKPPKERDVAMVFQTYSLYPHMNVYDNMAFGVQSRRMPKAEIEARVMRAAEILELEPFLKKKPRALSGGQQQRVAIGRAIARDPALFLMDEPLSNVDIRTRATIRGEIARIQRRIGVTTLYVTHDQTEALTLGDRIGVLREGRLVQVAPPQDLYRSPSTLFVAGFVGSPPMNLAEATLEETDGEFFVRFGGHRLRVGGSSSEIDDHLRRYAWRQVVIGIRPENLTNVDRDPEAQRLRVEVARREIVGPHVHLYFVVDAPLLLSEDPRRAGSEAALDGGLPVERENLWLAQVTASPADVGDVVELAVRSDRLNVFDPRTGDVIPN